MKKKISGLIIFILFASFIVNISNLKANAETRMQATNNIVAMAKEGGLITKIDNSLQVIYVDEDMWANMDYESKQRCWLLFQEYMTLRKHGPACKIQGWYSGRVLADAWHGVKTN